MSAVRPRPPPVAIPRLTRLNALVYRDPDRQAQCLSPAADRAGPLVVLGEAHIRNILREWEAARAAAEKSGDEKSEHASADGKKSGEDEEDISPPPDFVCPLSLDIMVEPIVVASGQTYERAFMDQWFEGGHRTCPVTNVVLPDLKMVPNKALKKAIFEWAERYRVELPDPAEVELRVKAIVKEASSMERDAALREQEMGVGEGEGEGVGVGVRGGVAWEVGPTRLRVRSKQMQMYRQIMERRKAAMGAREGRATSLGGMEPLPDLLSEVEAEEEAENQVDVDFLGSLKSVETLKCGGVVQNEEQRKIVSALRRISKGSSTSREVIAGMGAIPYVIQTASSSEGSILEDSLTSILNLAVESNLRPALVSNGAIKLLAEKIKSKQNLKAQAISVAALCNLAVDEGNRVAICETGVAPSLVHVLRSTEALRVRRDAALTLFNLSIDPWSREEIVKSKCVEEIIRILDDEEVEDVLKEDVLLLLSVVAKSKEARKRLHDEGALGVIAAFLNRGASIAVMTHTVAVLLLVAEGGREGRERVLDEVLLSRLFQMVENGTRRGRAKALALLTLLREG